MPAYYKYGWVAGRSKAKIEHGPISNMLVEIGLNRYTKQVPMYLSARSSLAPVLTFRVPMAHDGT